MNTPARTLHLTLSAIALLGGAAACRSTVDLGSGAGTLDSLAGTLGQPPKADGTCDPGLVACANVCEESCGADANVGASDAGADARTAPTSDASITPTKINVTGRVRTDDGKVFDGTVPGGIAFIGGVSAPIGADGTFSITGVTAPYDLWVTFGKSGLTRGVTIYQGLTTPTPHLTLRNAYGYDAATGSATVNVHVTNSPLGFPLPAYTALDVSSDYGDYDHNCSDTGDCTVTLALPLGTTTTIHVNAKITAGVGLNAPTTSWISHASVPVDVKPDDNLDVTVPLVAFGATKTITGSIANAQPGASYYADISAVAGAESFFTHAVALGGALPDNTWSFTVPDVGANWTILGVGQTLVAQGPGAQTTSYWSTGTASARPGDSSVTVTLPTPPSLLTPANGGAMPASHATFSWTKSVSGDVSHLQGSVAGYGSLDVYTTAASFTVPDLSKIGAPLSAGSLSWTVLETANHFAVDDEARDDAPTGAVTEALPKQTAYLE